MTVACTPAPPTAGTASGDASTPTAAGPATADRSPAPSGAAVAPSEPAPSTPTSAPARRPLAVAVAAAPPPRALAGLATAETVVEHPAGERLLVISRDDQPAIGPLRRATPDDAALAVAFDADLVAARATTEIVATLRASGLRVMEEGAPVGAVVRDPARRAPYNVYAVPSAARTDLPPPPDASTPWRLGLPPGGGPPTRRVDVPSGNRSVVTWRFDERTSRWLRLVDGEPQRTVNGAPVTAATVALVEVSSRQPPASALRGTGRAVVARAGRGYAARWRRSGPAVPPTLTDPGGDQPLPVSTPVWLHVCAAPCAAVPVSPRERSTGGPR